MEDYTEEEFGFLPSDRVFEAIKYLLMSCFNRILVTIFNILLLNVEVSCRRQMDLITNFM